jgi:hypothetical protein
LTSALSWDTDHKSTRDNCDTSLVMLKDESNGRVGSGSGLTAWKDLPCPKFSNKNKCDEDSHKIKSHSLLLPYFLAGFPLSDASDCCEATKCNELNTPAISKHTYEAIEQYLGDASTYTPAGNLSALDWVTHSDRGNGSAETPFTNLKTIKWATMADDNHMGKSEFEHVGMFLSLVALRAEKSEKTAFNVSSDTGAKRDGNFFFCGCDDDQGPHKMMMEVGIGMGKSSNWRNGYWIAGVEGGNTCGANAVMLKGRFTIIQARAVGWIDLYADHDHLECRPRIPMTHYNFEGKLRGAVVGFYSRLHKLIMSTATESACPHESDEYLTHGKSMWDLDYNCGDATSYGNDADYNIGLEGKLKLKLQGDYAKEVTVKYEIYSSDDDEEGNLVNRIHKNNEVIYECARVPLNTFVITRDGEEETGRHNFRNNFQKIPFVCVSTKCPSFNPIICDTNCEEQTNCILSIYEGKAIADYLFEYNDTDLDWAYEEVKQFTTFRLILERYSGAKSLDVVDENVTPTCWKGFKKNENIDAAVTAFTSASEGLDIDEGTVVLNDLQTRCVHDGNFPVNERFCEEWGPRGCQRCFYGFRPQWVGDLMLCYEPEKFVTLPEKSYTAFKFCKDLNNYCTINGEVFRDIEGEKEIERCLRWGVQDGVSMCQKCKPDFVLNQPGQKCKQNSICKNSGNNSQFQKCKKHNDENTHHHMNGCRKMKTRHRARADADYDGEWRCAECAPGFHQVSPYNEYCREMVSEVAEWDDGSATNLKNSLKECLEKAHAKLEVLNRQEECFDEGLFQKGDDHDSVTEHDVRDFIEAYQKLLAEQEVMITNEDRPVTVYKCETFKLDTAPDLFKFWSGWNYDCAATCGSKTANPDTARCEAGNQAEDTCRPLTNDNNPAYDSALTDLVINGGSSDKRTRALGLWWTCGPNDPQWCEGRMTLLDVMKLVLNKVVPNPWTDAGKIFTN